MHAKILPIAVALALTILAVMAAACGEGGSGLEVKDSYVSSTNDTVAALYFTVKNHGEADTLVSVSTSAAAEAMFHEDVVEGNSTSMQMRTSIPIPAKGEFTFRPGQFHVMLMDLTRPLKEGESIEVAVQFEKAGEKRFTAKVGKPGAESGHSGNH